MKRKEKNKKGKIEWLRSWWVNETYPNRGRGCRQSHDLIRRDEKGKEKERDRDNHGFIILKWKRVSDERMKDESKDKNKEILLLISWLLFSLARSRFLRFGS